jgi:hypothetical protein
VPLSLLLAPRVAGAHQAKPVLSWVAALPAHEAGLRLTAAATAMERAGLRSDGFVPPRWLASPGTVVALRRKGFALCADIVGVRDLHTGTIHRGRVQASGPARGPSRGGASRWS